MWGWIIVATYLVVATVDNCRERPLCPWLTKERPYWVWCVASLVLMLLFPSMADPFLVLVRAFAESVLRVLSYYG